MTDGKPLSDPPLPPPPARELVEKIGQGDSHAFDALYARHGRDVYRFAFSMCGLTDAAEDCTQEVFLGVWRNSSGYEARRGSVRAWLLGIARNKMMDRFRQHSRYELDLDTAVLADAVPPADQETGRRQRAEQLHRAILALPLRYREVVVFCELEELTYAEAAQLIDCPVGTVRSRLHRARQLLANKLRRDSAVRDRFDESAEVYP